jgi:hypothetical protein
MIFLGNERSSNMANSVAERGNSFQSEWPGKISRSLGDIC